MTEQFPATPTITPTGKRNPETGRPLVRYSSCLHNGQKRLRHPETDKPLLMTGDIINSVKGNPMGCYKLQWRGQWIEVPTIEEFTEWTLDSVCPTPDGDIVEPDHPDSWLSLVGLV